MLLFIVCNLVLGDSELKKVAESYCANSSHSEVCVQEIENQKNIACLQYALQPELYDRCEEAFIEALR